MSDDHDESKDRKQQTMTDHQESDVEATTRLPVLRGSGPTGLDRNDRNDRNGLDAFDPEAILAQPPDALDIAAELAAPPRRKLPLLRLLLFAGMVAGLAFGGGAYYQKHYGTAAAGTAGGFSARTGGGFGTGTARSGEGGAPTGGSGAEGGGFGGAGAAAGAGTGGGAGGAGSTGAATTGTVKLVDGTTVYLTTSSGSVVKVTTGSSTKITKSTGIGTSALLPGQTVTVEGTTDTSGDLAATSVAEG